jgi:hypothetical protein
MKMRKALIFCKVKWKNAIKEMRDKKATGDDDVPGDVLNLLGENGLRLMTQLMNVLCVTGSGPDISLKLQ